DAPPRRQSGLLLQRRDERAGLGDRLPDLREEGRPAMMTGVEHDAVDAGPQLAQQVLFVVERDRLVRAQERHLDRDRAEFARGEWQEARIAKRRGPRVGANIDREPAARLERADAAAEVGLLAQRDERRAGLFERRMTNAADVLEPELGAN